MRGSNLDGLGKQKCTRCEHRSVTGLKAGHGKCPYHFAQGTWGRKWASEFYPNHEEELRQNGDKVD